MTEDEFDRRIDCRFPYRDEGEWKRLVDLGRAISPNAHYRTLDEICRPPRSAAVTASEQLAMMRYWADGFDDPLKQVVMECATALIERRDLPVARVLAIMEQIAFRTDAYAALAIASFACDDPENRVEARRSEITRAWRGKNARG